MAFWFVLIFVCFIFLYILLWDYNTPSPQALVLMGRDAVAPSLVSALSLAAPNNDGPSSVATAIDKPTLAQLTTRGGAAPNAMQAGLAAAMSLLPARPPREDGEISESVVPPGGTRHETVAAAQAAATACVRRFLGM
jgi:hypothetical protein